jgi:hypothetical protein
LEQKKASLKEYDIKVRWTPTEEEEEEEEEKEKICGVAAV